MADAATERAGLDITEYNEGDVTIFTLKGRVDSAGAVDLDLALQTAISEKKHKMILDMANVRYINSSGLRTLADVLTQNKEHGGDLVLVALNSKISRVFEIIGFNNFFTMRNTVGEALTVFK